MLRTREEFSASVEPSGKIGSCSVEGPTFGVRVSEELLRMARWHQPEKSELVGTSEK